MHKVDWNVYDSIDRKEFMRDAQAAKRIMDPSAVQKFLHALITRRTVAELNSEIRRTNILHRDFEQRFRDLENNLWSECIVAGYTTSREHPIIPITMEISVR
jgi:hypothetical protein